MSDSVMIDPVEGNQSPAPERKYVSKRGRRLLIGVIVILLLALSGVVILLAGYVAPKGGVAVKDEAGGLEWVRSIYGWGRTPETQFYGPRKVNLTSSGDILVTDPGHKIVYEFSPTGKFVKTFGSKLKQVPPYGLASVAQGPEGAIFTGESELDRVQVMSASDGDLGKFPLPAPEDIEYKYGMMVIGAKSGFAVMDADKGVPKKLVGTYGKGPNQFDTVTGVAIGPDKTIYAVDAYNNRLSAYKPDGRRVWMVNTGGAANGTKVTGAGAQATSLESSAPARLSLPTDVTIDGNGRLVVVDGFDMSLALFDSKNGKFLQKYGASGSKDGQFMYPSSIVYDPSRDWFVVADTGNSRVQIVRIPGSGKVVSPAIITRSLSGPLRACVFPFLLLIIVLIAYVVVRSRKRETRPATPVSQA